MAGKQRTRSDVIIGMVLWGWVIVVTVLAALGVTPNPFHGRQLVPTIVGLIVLAVMAVRAVRARYHRA